MSDRKIYIGAILEEYYDHEDTERVCALGAHYELIDTRPGGHRKWRVVANPPAPAPTKAEQRQAAAATRAAQRAQIDAESIPLIRAALLGGKDAAAALAALQKEYDALLAEDKAAEK